jgi:hypothetical protein
LGETSFDLCGYYDKKKQKLFANIGSRGFVLTCKISVVDLTDGPEVDVNVYELLQRDKPKKPIPEETIQKIKQ